MNTVTLLERTLAVYEGAADKTRTMLAEARGVADPGSPIDAGWFAANAGYFGIIPEDCDALLAGWADAVRGAKDGSS